MDFSPKLRRLDFTLLLSLDALLELRNISRAAERVGVGQPAMSDTLRRLRRIFDDRLLVRSGNTHVLTALGRALVEPVATILSTAEKMLAMKPSFDPAVDSAEFTVVASDYVALTLLRPFLELAHSDAPNVSVRTIPVSNQAFEDIRGARLDLLIVPQQMKAAQRLSGFPHHVLFRDTYVPATCVKNDDVDSVDADVIRAQPYLRYQLCEGTDSVVDEQLVARNISPTVALTSYSLALLPALLPGTRMVGFVNQRLLRDSFAEGHIKIVPSSIPLEPIRETMFWHPASESDPAHTWLRETLMQLVDGL